MDDLILRQAVLKIIDGWYEQNRDTDNIEDLIVLITYMDSVNPQKPICPSAGIDCEDCPAYEKKPNINEVLDKIRTEIDTASFVDKDTKHCKNANASGLQVALNIIDKFIAEEDKA